MHVCIYESCRHHAININRKSVRGLHKLMVHLERPEHIVRNGNETNMKQKIPTNKHILYLYIHVDCCASKKRSVQINYVIGCIWLSVST